MSSADDLGGYAQPVQPDVYLLSRAEMRAEIHRLKAQITTARGDRWQHRREGIMRCARHLGVELSGLVISDLLTEMVREDDDGC